MNTNEKIAEYKLRLKNAKSVIYSLRGKVANYEREEKRTDFVIRSEKIRTEAFLRMLTTVEGRSLRRAICLIFYWDRLSKIPAIAVDEICKSSPKASALFNIVRNYANVAAMDEWMGTERIVLELMKFGYTEKEARIRTRIVDYSKWNSKKKATKKVKVAQKKRKAKKAAKKGGAK